MPLPTRRKSETFKPVLIKGNSIEINPNPCRIINGKIQWNEYNFITGKKAKMTAHQVWLYAQKHNLTMAAYKQMLIDNGLIKGK